MVAEGVYTAREPAIDCPLSIRPVLHFEAVAYTALLKLRLFLAVIELQKETLQSRDYYSQAATCSSKKFKPSSGQHD